MQHGIFTYGSIFKVLIWYAKRNATKQVFQKLNITSVFESERIIRRKLWLLKENSLKVLSSPLTKINSCPCYSINSNSFRTNPLRRVDKKMFQKCFNVCTGNSDYFSTFIYYNETVISLKKYVCVNLLVGNCNISLSFLILFVELF